MSLLEYRLTQRHTGVVSAVFFEGMVEERGVFGGLVPSDPLAVLKFYTNLDAGSVYERLRERHPQHEEHWLEVGVVLEADFVWNRHDARGDDRKMLLARRIDTSVWRVERPGQHPLKRVRCAGGVALPDVPFAPRSGPLTLIAGPGGEFKSLDKARLLMDVFGEDRLDWVAAGD